MMRALTRHLGLLTVVGAVGAVTVTTAVAQSDEQRPGYAVERVTEVQAAASDAMASLGARRDDLDSMSGDVAERIGEDAQFGINPGLSRLAIGQASGSLFLIPGDGHVCAALEVADGAALNCARTGDVAAGRAGPATVTLANGAIGIYGIVPDGVTEVAVATGTPDAATVAVARNAYLTAVPAGTRLRSVAYSGPDGRVEFDIKDPAEAFED